MMMAALLLSNALAALGYSAIRLSMKGAPRFKASVSRETVFRWLGAALILVSAMPAVNGAFAALVGWACWFFCVLPIAGLPLILLWPFNQKAALLAPPFAFTMGWAALI